MAQRFNRAMEIMGWRVPEEDNEVFGDEFEVESRGLLEVKGKGALEMFNVLGAPSLPLHIPKVHAASDETGVSSIFRNPEG